MSQSTDTVTAEYTVSGMTCDHCATSVREEISRIPGVRHVDVDLPSGRVSVTSKAPLPTEDVRSAVDEAGYDLVTGS